MQQKEILAHLSDIKHSLMENGIEKIGLFGSFANGQADLYSDIDIVIRTTPQFVEKFEGIKGFLFLEDLRESLRGKFHREIDICDESGLQRKETIKGAIYA